jgi:hypothetical protein
MDMQAGPFGVGRHWPVAEQVALIGKPQYCPLAQSLSWTHDPAPAPPSMHNPEYRSGFGAYPLGSPLHPRLVKVPSQAHPATMALHIGPFGGGKHWPVAEQAAFSG